LFFKKEIGKFGSVNQNYRFDSKGIILTTAFHQQEHDENDRQNQDDDHHNNDDDGPNWKSTTIFVVDASAIQIRADCTTARLRLLEIGIAISI